MQTLFILLSYLIFNKNRMCLYLGKKMLQQMLNENIIIVHFFVDT